MKKQNTQGHSQNHFKVVANIGKTVLNDIGWRKNKKKGNKKSPFGIKSYFPDPIPGNDCEKIPGKGGQFKGKPVFTENQKEGIGEQEVIDDNGKEIGDEKENTLNQKEETGEEEKKDEEKYRF